MNDQGAPPASLHDAARKLNDAMGGLLRMELAKAKQRRQARRRQMQAMVPRINPFLEVEMARREFARIIGRKLRRGYSALH